MSSTSSSLKVFERQKRKESNPDLNAASISALPRSSRSIGGGTYEGGYDAYGRPSITRRPGESPIRGVEPLYPPGGSNGVAKVPSSRRSDTGSVRSVDSTSLYRDLNSRTPYDASSSRLDSSFASAGAARSSSYSRPVTSSYGGDFSFQSEPLASSRTDSYGRYYPPEKGNVQPPKEGVPVATASNFNDGSDAYGRDILPPRRDRNLATWSRPALEARVETLERLLSEQQSLGKNMPTTPDDRDLAEHLQVTVRKNRELRAELEVTKNRLATLMEEREAFALKLNRDNDSLQSLLEEAQRAKEALGNCIKTLSAEKAELATRLALAEDEIIRLKAVGASPAVIQFDEVRGNIEDVAVINEGLKESLRQMQLKNSTYNIDIGGVAPDTAENGDARDLL